MSHETRVGIAICTPIPFERNNAGNLVRSMVSIEWHRARQSLSLPTNYNSIECIIDGEEVGVARNIAVKQCMEHSPRPKYLLFIDYDVIVPPDAAQKLIYRAEHFPDYDVFAGVYCAKTQPAEPLIYKGDGQGPFWDWTVGDLLFDITGVHMGLTLIRLSLFDRIAWDNPDAPLFLTQGGFTIKNGGISSFRGTEDLYFCKRIREEVKAKVLVDTSVLAGHMDHGSRTVFGLPNDSLPVKRAEWLRFGEPDKEGEEPKLKALDLGAGDYKREWKGYKTYTTDLRGDTKPDYVMDSRWLNLPDNSFDLVASSHHLEHLPRFEQDKVWSEIHRICKPGGKIEHIVPNGMWAAAKMIEVETGRDKDGFEDTMNILYGAQESHGYERLMNLHYFIYTPTIAKALAESAGFVEVAVEDYTTDANNGYNLIVKGRKLNEGEERPAEKTVDLPAAIKQRLKPAKKGGTNGFHKKRKLTKTK